MALTTAVAVFAGALLAFALPSIDWPKLLNVSAAVSLGEVRSTVAAAVALVLLGLPASLSNRILAGFQEVHVSNLVVAVGTASNLVGLLAGIALRVSMPVLFLLATGWITLANLALLAVLGLWRKPWLRPRTSLLDWAVTRDLLSSGTGFLLIQIAGVVVFSSDNVVLSHFLGPAQVTPYNVTWRLVGETAVMPGLLFPALRPAYAEAYARGDLAWMRRTFQLTLRGTFALNLAFAAALLSCGQALVRWWAGAAAVPSFSLLAMMSLWAVISGAMTVESCLLAAVNRTRVQGVLSMIAAAANLGLSIVLVQRVGAVGVIAGTVVSYMLVLVVPQSLLVRQALNKQTPAAPISRRPVTQYKRASATML